MRCHVGNLCGVLMGVAGLMLGMTAANAQTPSDTETRSVTIDQTVSENTQPSSNNYQKQTDLHRTMRATALHRMQESQNKGDNGDTSQTLKNPFPRYDKPLIFETRRYRRELEWQQPIGNTPRYFGLWYW